MREWKNKEVSIVGGVVLFQVDIDDLLDEPVPGELQVVSLHRQEVKLPRLVQGLEADPVLGVDGALPQWLEHVRLAGVVELKVPGLAGLHHGVLVVLHHHEVFLRQYFENNPGPGE